MMSNRTKPGRAMLDVRPELLDEWDFDKNDEDPVLVSRGSSKKVWWRCSECGHEWEAIVSNRANGYGCPQCGFQGKRDVRIDFRNPELLFEWDYEKNDSLPKHFGPKSGTKVWWICFDCQHSWLASIKNRASGGGCPQCSHYGRRNERLDRTNPELLKEWDYERNDKTPDQVSFGSSYRAWWNCSVCRRSWEAPVSSRAKGHNCPSCARERRTWTRSGQKSFLDTTPRAVDFWDYTKNDRSPDQYMPRSSERVWFVCPDCSYTWESRILSVEGKDHLCVRCGRIKAESIEQRNPEIALLWDEESNGVAARFVGAGSMKKYHWRCLDCGHRWVKDANDMLKRLGCPKCVHRVPDDKILSKTFPELMLDWDYDKNVLDPATLHIGSKKRVHWKCHECHYEWEVRVRDRTETNTKCVKCLHRTYGEPAEGDSLVDVAAHLLDEWDYERNCLSPESYSRGSDRSAHWVCSEGHRWEAVIRFRVAGSGCPQCVSHQTSKVEIELYDTVVSLLGSGVTVLNRDRSYKSIGELDVFIPSLSIAIEFNGLYWHSEEMKKNNTYHQDKWQACRDQGIQLLTVWEDDWKYERNLVESMLAHKLGASKSIKVFARNTHVSTEKYSAVSGFLDRNHIQGAKSGSLYLTLRNKENELVAVSVWTKSGSNVVLDRYATSVNVVGGMGKLISHVMKTMDFEEIHTFAAHDVSDGSLYEKLGFAATDHLPADYSYIVKGRRVHKFNYRKDRFKNDPALLWEEDLTETQLADLNGLRRIWDCGKTKYTLSKN